MNKICIVGLGYVGLPLLHRLSFKNKVQNMFQKYISDYLLLRYLNGIKFEPNEYTIPS